MDPTDSTLSINGLNTLQPLLLYHPCPLAARSFVLAVRVRAEGEGDRDMQVCSVIVTVTEQLGVTVNGKTLPSHFFQEVKPFRLRH